MSGARPMRDAVVTLKVPFTVRKRGGRRLVLAPDTVEAILDGR